jgi:hypothetical protein
MKDIEKIMKKSCIGKLWANMNADTKDETCIQARQMMENICETGPLKKYLLHSLIPSAAAYKVLIKNGMSEKEAYDVIKRTVFNSMEPARRRIKVICSLSSFPRIFNQIWKRIPSFVIKNFPSRGWDIQWIKKDKHEIKFNMNSCFYCDFFRVHKCPELTRIFCDCDHIIYGSMKGFKFIRSQTMGKGAAKCDFCFKKA